MPAGPPNLIGAWTKVGTGTMTVNATTGAVSVTPAGDDTATVARQQIATEIGKTYWLTYELQTSAQMWRTLGTAAGQGDIIGVNVSTVPETKLQFTATTTSIWLDFARTALNTTTVGNIRLEEAPAGFPAARRLNGRSNYFSFDAATAGLRRWNSLQYLGGWFKLQYMPTAGVYLLDFAIPDVTTSGGSQRARIVYDPVNSKMLASNGGSAANGNKYSESYRSTTGLTADTWHYVGIRLAGDGAVAVVYDSNIGGTIMGNGVPEVGQYLNVLHLGSRNGSTPTSFAPAILSDWIWCEGFVPTNDQILALAAGNRPTDIAGFAPTFYWPLEGAATTEASVTGTATLAAPVAPAVVVGPSYIVPPPDDTLPIIFF